MIAALVLAGLVLTAGLSGTLRYGGVALLTAMSLLWLVVNGPMEGAVLLVITPGHGITGADLAAFAGFGLAAYRAVAIRRGPGPAAGDRSRCPPWLSSRSH